MLRAESGGGDSMAGLREAAELHSSVSPFYHPALSVPGCQTIYYYIYSLSLRLACLAFSAVVQFRFRNSVQDVIG